MLKPVQLALLIAITYAVLVGSILAWMNMSSIIVHQGLV